ncbi:hypothetical protein TRAPUB_8798 [Trametes pubescens]|uniref:Uncharacterized protein n=1 Tax=Trametes pubescens TaxID=154538 RepID=A0A1M2W4D2_TRAPU|nr:hypothetical protein TRAPUB_8798 [Trametes pubescens]
MPCDEAVRLTLLQCGTFVGWYVWTPGEAVVNSRAGEANLGGIDVHASTRRTQRSISRRDEAVVPLSVQLRVTVEPASLGDPRPDRELAQHVSGGSTVQPKRRTKRGIEQRTKAHKQADETRSPTPSTESGKKLAS